MLIVLIVVIDLNSKLTQHVFCSPQYAVTEPRKQAYADFYKQYDAVKEFNAMREAGIFESVRPSGE